jgi:5-methylcytosine-specific restriction endonuclease McrA
MTEDTRITLMVAGLRTIYKNTNNTRPDRNLLSIWHRAVLARDGFKCRNCGATKGQGKDKRLHAHHIKPWDEFPHLRFILDNGKTLCHPCHLAEHKREKDAVEGDRQAQ